MSSKETQHSSSGQGISIVRSTNVYSSPALRRRRGMCCTQWKVHDIENKDEEVTRANCGKRQWECYRNRIANDADESSQRKILIVLYRLKNIVMDALERRSRTHLAKSSVQQRGTSLWLPKRPPTDCCSRPIAVGNGEVGRPLLRQAGAHGRKIRR